MLFVRHRPTLGSSDDGDDSSKDWAYIGSANCSESAWGKLVASSKSPKLNCRNWECGVVIPLRRLTSNDGEDPRLEKVMDGTVLAPFERAVPVPMQYPGEEYGDRKPWFYSEN